MRESFIKAGVISPVADSGMSCQRLEDVLSLT